MHYEEWGKNRQIWHYSCLVKLDWQKIRQIKIHNCFILLEKFHEFIACKIFREIKSHWSDWTVKRFRKKTLISRNFQAAKPKHFVAPSAQLRKFTLMLFWQNFRESNIFYWRNYLVNKWFDEFYLAREHFRNFHNVVCSVAQCGKTRNSLAVLVCSCIYFNTVHLLLELNR